MNANQVIKGADSNKDEEKTEITQYIEEVKTSIYSVFYLLLKNQETSSIRFTILLIVEYFQLLSYSFDESVQDKWGAPNVINYFTQFMSTFRVVYWLEGLKWDIYIIIFYVCLFLVFVILLDFLYISISFKLKKLNFSQPIQLLNTVCGLLVSLLFIPFSQLFLSLSACSTNASGVLTHVIFSEVMCFQSIHIFHVLMSYVMLLFLTIIAYLTTILFFESRYQRNSNSKINIASDVMILVSKAAYVFVFTLFASSDYALFKTIVLVAFSTGTFGSIYLNRPYNDYHVQLLVEFFSGFFAWTNWVLLLAQVLSGTMFTAALQILLLGVPILIIILYFKGEARYKLLMTSEKFLTTGETCRKKNFFYFYIIDTRESIRESGIILKGYVNHHSEICPFDACPIKAFKLKLQTEKITNVNERKKWAANDAKNSYTDSNQLLLSQAKAMFINGMRKFPKSLSLRIDYANFLLSRMRDRKGALGELTKVEKERPSFDQQFQIYRMRKVVEDELAESHESGGMDFIAAMNFETTFKMFKQAIERSANLHFEFWNHLQDDSPDLVRVSMQGAKINASIQAVEDSWRKLSRMSNNSPKAIKLYATFLIEVLNDKEAGNEQMIKAKEAANMKSNFEMGAMGNQENDVNAYAQDGTPCIYISGETDRLGVINQCNMSLCKIFGYLKKDEILNKNIKMLQPRIYSDSHDRFLKESIAKVGDQISSRERQIFGKHLSGYIIPLWLQIKNLPSLLSGRQFVATFKVEKTGVNKQVGYMLFDNNNEIVDISPACIQMLGISQETISKRQIYYDVSTIFPDLFHGNKVNSIYLNKQGGQLTFKTPKLVEFIEKSITIRDSDNQPRGGRRRGSTTNISAMDWNNEDKSQIGDQEGDENGDNNNNDDSASVPTSYRFNREKSTVSQKQRAIVQAQNKDNSEDEDNKEDEQKYMYRAVGTDFKPLIFQANMSEIFFELINQRGGYYLRLESVSFGKNPNQMSAAPREMGMMKRLKQMSFQFSYDPIFKRFNRELRDTDNRNHLVDHFFLDLKVKKEQSKADTSATPDPNIQRYAQMSYINFLQRQQRMRELGKSNDNFEEEDEEPISEDESENSDMTRQNSRKQVQETGVRLASISPEKTAFLPKTPINQTGGIDYRNALLAGEGFGKDFIKSEIDRLIKILLEKQSCASGIHTFIRSEGQKKGWEENNNQKAGLFSDRGEGMEKSEDEQEEEEMEQRKDKKENKGDADSLKANIKSKKAFSMAINDKTMPPAISRLSNAAQILLLLLITIAIIEYAIIYSHFSDLKENFSMIGKSYLRTAELQKVAYNARTMILMAAGMLTNYAGYPSATEYSNYIKNEFSASLDLIYTLQNEINLSKLPVSDEHDQLLNNKTVTLYFKENVMSMKALPFSLTESILQVSSTIFTISKMAIATFTEGNEDVFFLMYNSFNEFYLGLKRSSQLYITEMSERVDQKEEISLVLFILAILCLIVCFFILIPVVNSVNKQKDRVLSLFCEIDNGVLKVLAFRCDKFISSLLAEEGADEIESHEALEGDVAVQEEADEYNLLSGSVQRQKKAKGQTKTDSGFFFQFICALMVLFAYYLQNFLLNTDAVNVAQTMSKELNVTALTEPFYWFALNAQREMIYNPDRVITNQNSLLVVRSSIYQLYEQQNDLQQNHLKNQASLDQTYLDMFESLMRDGLCDDIDYFRNSTQKCPDFISGSLQEGLHVVIVRYFETLRNNLNAYQQLKYDQNQTGINGMFNLKSFNELYVIQNHVTQVLMRNLVSTLSSKIQSELQYRIERKIAIFIVFVIVVLVAFVLFWLPFLSSLNLEIYKTKLMLLIIPLDVLLKIKNVTKVLQSQNFMQQTQKKGGSGKKGSM